MKKLILIVTGLFMTGLSLNAIATNANVAGVTVQRILIDSKYYGGCMILVDKVLADYGLNCEKNWVSFSCDGTFNSQAIAFRKLDQAQMAMALNKTVFLIIDDSKKHNSYCFAQRIDIKKE